MFQVGLIVFREVLEVALVIGILALATAGVKGRTRYILLGLLFGILGSILIAFFTDTIANLFNGVGQEVFNGSILLLSSVMISWTVIWMTKHGKNISANLKKVGKSVADGEMGLFALLPIVVFSVLREGTEVVLFSYSSFVAGENIPGLIFGAVTGLVCGIVVGLALYFGLLKVLGKYFFMVTSWMLIFLAAGMAASAMSFLSASGLVPDLGYPIWDSSFLISEEGFLGKVLHALIGYVAKPSGIQVIVYFLMIIFLFVAVSPDHSFNRSKGKK